jgi:hypothetical protein
VSGPDLDKVFDGDTKVSGTEPVVNVVLAVLSALSKEHNLTERITRIDLSFFDLPSSES